MSHFHAANGSYGCLFDTNDTHDTEESAISSLIDLFGDSIGEEEESRMLQNLQECGTYHFDSPSESGADYCTVFECAESYCEGVYEVTCANVGTVYHGLDAQEARNTYSEYCEQSKQNYGRAAGEDVALWFEGDIEEEYSPNWIDCDSCAALVVNGVFCHETDCPNQGSRYDRESETWVRQYTCRECGCQCDDGTECCVAIEEESPSN